MALEKINQVNDIKKLSPKEYDQLALEIREFLIDTISRTKGQAGVGRGASVLYPQASDRQEVRL